MLKSLNQAVSATGRLSIGVPSRPTANQRSKSLTLVLLGVAAIVFTIGSGIGYVLYSQIGRAQSKVANLQAQAGSSVQIARRYQTTLQDYSDTSSKLQFLETSVAPDEYVPTLLQQLQALAQTTNLQVVSVKPSPLASTLVKPAAAVSATSPATSSPNGAAPVAGLGPAKAVAPPPYDTQPITVDVNGTYSQIMAFIYDLPKFPKILCLKSLTLSPKGAAGTASKSISPAVEATLVIDAYVFNPPTAAGPGTGSAN